MNVVFALVQIPPSDLCHCDKHESPYWRLIVPHGTCVAYWMNTTKPTRLRRRRRDSLSAPRVPPMSPMRPRQSSSSSSSSQASPVGFIAGSPGRADSQSPTRRISAPPSPARPYVGPASLRIRHPSIISADARESEFRHSPARTSHMEMAPGSRGSAATPTPLASPAFPSDQLSHSASASAGAGSPGGKERLPSMSYIASYFAAQPNVQQ